MKLRPHFKPAQILIAAAAQNPAKNVCFMTVIDVGVFMYKRDRRKAKRAFLILLLPLGAHLLKRDTVVLHELTAFIFLRITLPGKARLFRFSARPRRW